MILHAWRKIKYTHIGKIYQYKQWTLTYTDTSIPKMTVEITEFLDK